MADHADPDAPHLILVGLPGSGKTTAGRAVAGALQRRFLDFDEEIERRTGMTVSEVFRLRGEPAFRQMEADLTDEAARTRGMVLAPGGGWITNERLPQLLRPTAHLIYLRVRPETALERMGSARVNRPLLDLPDPLETLRRLLGERMVAYEGADLVLDSETMTLQEVTSRIISFVSGA